MGNEVKVMSLGMISQQEVEWPDAIESSCIFNSCIKEDTVSSQSLLMFVALWQDKLPAKTHSSA